MPLPSLIQAIQARFRATNNNAWDAVTNALGFGNGGHRQNLPPRLDDLADVLDWQADTFDAIEALREAVAQDKVLTGIDAQNTQKDREATNATVLVAAKWASAPEDQPVSGGLFSAFHGARKAAASAAAAAASAAGVNMPPIGASDAGKYPRTKADRSGYELVNLPFATQAEANAGTGNGIITATTLIPAATGAAKAESLSTVPVGTIVMWPFWALSAPGDRWLEAKGQVAPLSSYPALEGLLRAYTTQFGRGHPAWQPTPFSTSISSGTGQNSPVGGGATVSGSRIVTMQSQYVTYTDVVSGKALSATGNYGAMPWYSGQAPRPLLRDNDDLIFFINQQSRVGHLDFSTQATLNQGQQNAAFNDPANSFSNYEGLYKLPNGNVVCINYASNGSDGTFYRVWRLPAAANYAGWVEVTLPVVGAKPKDIYHFQTKNGDVYIASRPTGSTGNFTLLKTTDGVTWTNVLTFTQASIMALTPPERRDVQARQPNMVEQSPDGQMILVSIGAGFLISKNGGAAWAYTTPTTLLGLATGASGFTAIGINNASALAFYYDTTRARWYIGGFLMKSGFSPATRKFVVIWSSTDLTTFTKVCEAEASGVATGSEPSNPKDMLLYIDATNVLFCAVISGFGPFWYQFPLATPPASLTAITSFPYSGGGTISPSNIRPSRRLEDYPFDGLHMSVVYSSSFGMMQVDRATGEMTLSIPAQNSGFDYYDYGVTKNGATVLEVAGSQWIASSTEYIYKGPPYSFNPATERRLPNLSMQGVGNLPAIAEFVRPTASTPKFYMRVK